MPAAVRGMISWVKYAAGRRFLTTSAVMVLWGRLDLSWSGAFCAGEVGEFLADVAGL